MNESLTHTVEAPALRELMVNLFRAVKVSEESAQTAAEVLYEAELRGYGSHGLIRLPTMVRRVQTGMIKPKGKPKIVQERDGTALVDAGLTLGPVGALYGAEVAARKAKHAGCCAVGVVNGNHICLAGYYPEQIARQGLIGILMTVTMPLSHVWGGWERLLGTNPLAIAIPTGKGYPVLVDFATTEIAFGKVLKARARGETIPERTAMGPDGKPTTDSKMAAQGALTPLGGHKGFGLSLAIGLLAGPLVGARVGKALGKAVAQENHYDKGDLIIAIDPSSFGDPEAFLEAVAVHLQEVKSSPLAPGFSGIRIPGERSFEERKRHLVEGISIEREVWDEATALAKELSVPMPG